MPLLFAAVGVLLLLLAGYARRQPLLNADVQEYTGIGAAIVLIIAAGWALATLVDALLQRQLSKLKLDVADNLDARRAATRLDVIRRIWIVVAATLTVSAALTVIPGVRQIGFSLFASAGIAGLALGLAARPMLSNLIAGLQIAFTQPVRIDDVVVIEGEWGWIEEIGLFYVTVRLWDRRRLVVPLSRFIEAPFQNWTRQSASIIGSVFWSLDYRAPIGAMRDKLRVICESTELWDGDVINLQVTDTDANTIRVRALASARNSPDAWNLRCLIREQIVVWLQQSHPQALPRFRLQNEAADTPDTGPAEAPFQPDRSLREPGG